MNRHRDPTFATTFREVGKWPIHVQVSHYATVACRRLERIGSNGKKQAKKPTDDEINQSRVRPVDPISAPISVNCYNYFFPLSTGSNISHQYVWQYIGRGHGVAKR